MLQKRQGKPRAGLSLLPDAAARQPWRRCRLDWEPKERSADFARLGDRVRQT